MGKGPSKRLSALGINALTKPGTYGDGDNLYLRVRPDGSKSWLFRYKLANKANWMSLGPLRDVPLAEAREAARKLRNQIRDGINPLEQRRERQTLATNADGRTFDAVAGLYIEAHRAGWKNEKHAAQWASTLKTYASPVIGNMSVGSVGLDEVLRILRPIWQEKPETASRLRGRIEAVLDYAGVHGWRKGDNPARWTGYLDQVLPAKTKVSAVVHHAALPWADIPAVWEQLTAASSTSALCLRFLILTAARSGEARGARWNEIDLAAKVWTVPAARMKAKQEHRVPLSDNAIAILEVMQPLQSKPDGLIFPGGAPGKPMSDVALSKALAAVAEGFTVHGCRSSFRDWCAETTNYPREIAETALAHTNKNKVEAAYLRGDHFEKRRQLMAAWARHCTSPAATGGNVRHLHASA
ncbi:tyrosine-type recombinase/integrase [Acidocella aminolytica]|uniref:Phage integrase n=1 Tax=Acidocella aminolytica 101 = DSM 11237 TaxID=1120923 RepID=A0A0D6PDT8_9PROT|nr:site-specific integrase [Acidocella aminolytica]GAN79029.1 phage integrase [Acidocella aminolytica 101 = DSM 11237]GBQ38462.1 phage integrase [Acidocella aminolytica 101 = DSM 11237]SHF37951.1 Integrase [Acidocella aminolytica 101 = DSM 11237]